MWLLTVFTGSFARLVGIVTLLDMVVGFQVVVDVALETAIAAMGSCVAID